MKKYLLLAFALVPTAVFGNGLLPTLAQVQKPSVPPPSTAPLNYNLLQPDAKLSGLNVITSETTSPTGLTSPSLWWPKDQFDPFAGKLLTNWLAYPNEHRVDLVVNRQLWSLLDSFGRYSFVNKFGTVAREYGYNTRVFILNQPNTPLATYTCNFSTAPPLCDINFELSSQGALRSITPEVNGLTK